MPKGLTPRRRQNIRYWTQFCDDLRQRGSQFRLPKPRDSHYVDFWIGTYRVRARQIIKPCKEISVTFIVERMHSRTNYFHSLKKQQVEIEKEFGESLLWEEMHGEKRVSLIRINTDPTNEKDWYNQYEWMVTQLEKLIEVFHPRIKGLS